MNESVVKKLIQEAREKEVERKTKAFKKEQIEREKAKQVWLTRAIYVKLLASRTPIIEEIRNFEPE